MSEVTNSESAFEDLIISAHACVYAYGIVAAFSENQELALDCLAIHRKKRDELIGLASANGIKVPPADIAYEIPVEVSSAVTSNACAASIEESLCAHWAQATHYLPNDMQADSVTFAQSCAQRAFEWSGISKAFYV